MESKHQVIIEADTRALKLNLKEVLRYKDLILLFVKRDFISLYKQTILGPLWAIIQPLLTTVVITLVFGNFAGLSADGVPTFAFYLSGTIIWTYFSTCLTATANTFIGNKAILGKVYFPRLVMPISTVLSKLITLFIQYVIFLAFFLYYLICKVGIQPNIYILLTPVLIVQLAMLSLGCGIIISAVTIKYRDLAMALPFITEIWKYLSPVAYDMYKLDALAPGGRLHNLYMLNPVTPIINVFRNAYLGIGQIDWFFFGIGWISTAAIFLLGVVMFNRVERTFADTI